MERRPSVVLVDKDHVELLQTELHALERCNLNLVQVDYEEGRVGEMNEAVRRRLELDVRPERNTLERELTERDLDVDILARL